MEAERRLRSGSADNQGETVQPVYSGAHASETKLAVEQIERTFAASKRIKVGCAKLDQYGNEIPGVTAVAVQEILPLQHAQMVKLCVVINDDEVPKEAVQASSVNNGLLMHSFVDDEGITR